VCLRRPWSMTDHLAVAGDAPGIVLVNPPAPEGKTVNREGFGGLGVLTEGVGGFVYPSHRLAEAAGLLRAEGHDVCGLDFVLRGASARKALRRGGAWVAAVVHVSVNNLDADLDAARGLRDRVAGGRLVVTGVGLGAHARVIEERCPGAIVDADATGYGAALRVLAADPDPGAPDGWPDACWETMPLASSRRLPIYHGRGCIHACDYCPYVIATGRRHVLRSPDTTAREFAAQVARHRPKRVVFRDPVFGLDAQGTLELLSRIEGLGRRQRARFEIETRPELLTAEMMDALSSAGCAEIKLGVETLEPAALVASHRVADEAEAGSYGEAVEAALAGARGRGLRVRPYVMLGLAGATHEGHGDTCERVGRWAEPEVKEVSYPQGGAPGVVG